MSLRARLLADSGVVAPVTAVVMAVLIGTVGLVTDAGVWYARRDQLQAATDAAALAAAPYADDAGAAREAADAVLRANGLDPAAVVTRFEIGQYCTDEAVAQRFQPGGCADADSAVGDAVRVATGAGAPLFLSRLFTTGRSGRRIATVATAARVNQAGIQAGTGLAALNGGIANAMLSALTGGSVSLSAVQYDGLLNTNVDALAFFDALAARVGVTAGTYESLLGSDVGVGDVIDAQIAALQSQGSIASTAAAIAGLRAIRAQISGNPQIALGRLFDLGLWSARQVGEGTATRSALHAGINLMQLVSFSLQLANGRNLASVPGTIVGIPGLATLQVAATAIEPPQRPYFSFGPEGTQVHTAQVRVKLNLEVLGLTQQLGIGAKVPLYIEAASGDARIDAIDCDGDPSRDATVDVSARGGVANVYLGTVSDSVMRNFSAPVSASAVQPVRVLNVGLLGVVALAETAARAHIAIGSTAGAATDLSFVQPTGTPEQPVPPTRMGVIGRPATDSQTASVPIVARATSTQFGTNLLGGLAETLSLKVCVLSLFGTCILGNTRTLTGADVGPLYAVLDPVLTGLDPVVDSLLRSLGVQLGYVDVAVTGVRCGLPVLVS